MFNKVWLKDTFERVLATFLEAFLGALTADALISGVNLDVAKKAGLSGLIAAFALAKAAVAELRSGTVSPASLAKG